MSSGLLYISYTGMLEPLGQSQVLAYQARLAAHHRIHLISFERAADWRNEQVREAVAARMRAAGICWYPMRYHKRFSVLSTAWDILRGVAQALCLVRKHDVAVVHARSYVATTMALVVKRLCGKKLLFDMRGFWPDERVDGGLWPRGGRMYRVAKWFERLLLLGADHVVSLTEAAVDEMARFDYLQGRMPPVTVIPTCADLSRFTPRDNPRPGFTLGYVGSAGTWYSFDAVVDAFRLLRQRLPQARLLVINRNEHDYIRERLQVGGVSLNDVEIRSATHSEVPAQMSRMHAGIFFIKPVFSKQASAPTKLGELLGCGVPCLSNAGVGDMAGILEGGQVGVAIADFETATLQAGLDRLLDLVRQPDIRQRCVEVAHRHFSLEHGVARYLRVYSSLGLEAS